MSVSRLSALVFAVSFCSAMQAVDAPAPARRQELEHLLRHDCGSCHGLTLRGGLGSPLTTEALSGKPYQYLYEVIRNGIPGTPMPPWSAVLEDADIRWLTERLLSPENWK